MSQSNLLSFPEKTRIEINQALERYYNGHEEEALNLLEKLAEKENPEVYVFIAAFFEKGTNHIKKDYNKAKYFYEKSLNEYGAVESYLGLARIYLNGLGVEKDYCKALEYYNELIEKTDDGLAHLNIGLMTQNGMCKEVDLEEAEYHFQSAWKQGYILGLTYLGKLEQEKGRFVSGMTKRLKAGLAAFKLGLKNPHDVRLRSGL